jgi:uncharacterized protein YhfF
MMDDVAADWRGLDTFSFGDGPQMADELLALVIEGRKTATCWAASQGKLGAEPGKRFTVLDGAGRPRAVIETVELVQLPFDDVDPAFAHDEGEGDRTLESWRASHRDYFTREGTYAPDMLLWCERFQLIQILDPSRSG